MAPFVILAIALAAAAVGATFVVGLRVLAAGRRLRRATKAAADQIGVVTRELSAQAATTRAELAALQERREASSNPSVTTLDPSAAS